MKQVTHIRRVTPRIFANWLEHNTSDRIIRTISGVFHLQRARATNALNKVSIDGTWEESSSGRVLIWDDCISFELVPLDAERTEITATCRNESATIPEYFDDLLVEIDRCWRAEGSAGGEPTLRILQQFVFDADAKDVLMYFMGGETERRWVDPPYALMVGKPMAFRGLLHPSSSSQALYALQLHVYICDGEAVDLDRYNESGYWIARQAFAAVIYLSQDRPGTCTAQLYFQTNPLYWYGEWNAHCAPPLAESLGELFVGALWQSWIDGWLAMKTVMTTAPTRQEQMAAGAAQREASNERGDSSAIIRRLDEMHSDLGEKLDDIKRSQEIIYERIGAEAQVTVDSILNEVREQSISQDEMQRTLDAVRRVLQQVQKTGLPIDDPGIKQSLAKIQMDINSNLDFKQRFELSLPVIPFLLEYKVELDAGADLGAIWEEFKERVKKKRE